MTKEGQRGGEKSRKLSRREQELLARQKYNRRKAMVLIGGAAAAGVIGIGLAATRPWESSSLPTVTPQPEAAERNDPDLSRLKSLEGSYQRYDLKDVQARQEHLKLFAKAYSKYSGTAFTEQEVAGMVVWLPADEYDKSIPNFYEGSGGYTTTDTHKVMIREEYSTYQSATINKMRTIAPYWSALSSARLIYSHEIYHQDGVRNKKELSDEQIWQEFAPGRKVTQENGFIIYSADRKDPNTIIQDIFLEEAFVEYSVMSLEKRMFGTNFVIKRPETGPRGEVNILINLGIATFQDLFEKHPEWEEVFRQHHRDSDLIGLARFIGSHSKKQFSSAQERDTYGMKVLRSINVPSDEASKNLEEFIK